MQNQQPTNGEVEVRVYVRPDRTMYYHVSVRSAVKPRVRKHGILEVEGESMQKDRQRIGALAGALAEELCEQYSDTLDPSDAARTAMSAHRELVMETPVLLSGRELPRVADRFLTKH